MSEILIESKSTQKELKQRLISNSNLENFYWIQALSQTEGRGRQERVWNSPPGNLYISILLRGPQTQMTWITHRVSIALRETLIGLKISKDQLKIKWPNDLVWIESNQIFKLAGIICEKIGDHFVIGVGLNVSVNPIVDRPTKCVTQLLGEKILLDQIRDQFLLKLQDEFSTARTNEELIKLYMDALFFSYVHEIKWGQESGKFLKIGTYGELIVETNGQEKALFSEEVHLSNSICE